MRRVAHLGLMSRSLGAVRGRKRYGQGGIRRTAPFAQAVGLGEYGFSDFFKKIRRDMTHVEGLFDIAK